ncbi:tRNA (adenine(22)-N(1))-methyltransferase TrmK [Bacillus tianshenii]|nr:tRNA (adenine(22)-N(1))-methyltransferase TrmK [Bacillus tianshenii]
MNEIRLSERLCAVVDEIPKNSTIADIGSDHAYLPCYAYLRGVISEGIAGEINEGPWKSALEQVKRCGIESKISVRRGNGLEVMAPGEVDVVVVAGMGGQLIASILEDGKEKLAGVKRLVLQPNVGARFIRIWLRDNGWELKREQILEEDEKIYEILTADRGDANVPYKAREEAALLFGPFLMKEKNEAFCKKWQYEYAKWKKIVQQMEGAEQNEALAEKRAKIESRMKLAEEVL